jgi:tRNA (cmo5U34)-methyltransferase
MEEVVIVTEQTSVGVPSLGHYPATDHWEFDSTVAQVFDDMLERSIPQHQTMRHITREVACRFVQLNTAVVDLGCARGEGIATLLERFPVDLRFVGVDVSGPMLDAARRRFRDEIEVGIVDIRHLDLRDDYPPEGASVTLSILTLQFTPINYRQRIVQQVYDHLVQGGAFILVEKLLGASADLDELMVDVYHRMKQASGYSEDEIKRKQLALEGVLVPVTAHWNEELLRIAGFRQVDCYWRWMNFGAWLAVK